MKLIFLDVDGVLNTWEYWEIQERPLKLVKDLVLNTGAKIVLSSNWRLKQTLGNAVEESLAVEIEVPKEDIFVGITPSLGTLSKAEHLANAHTSRTDEILLWLRENVEYRLHGEKVIYESDHVEKSNSYNLVWRNNDKIQLDGFVVLDDFPLHKTSCYQKQSKFADHFVQTVAADALTLTQAKKAEEILLKDFSANVWANATFTPCSNPRCIHKTKSKCHCS